MSETKHTPGPWIVARRPNGHKHDDIVSGPKRIASIGLSTIGNPDESAANARLIAAAPELLEALKGCVEQLYSPNFDVIIKPDVEPYSIKKAREVIAKVEGCNG